MSIAADLIDPLTMPITWGDIGGLKDTIEDVKVRGFGEIYMYVHGLNADLHISKKIEWLRLKQTCIPRKSDCFYV